MAHWAKISESNEVIAVVRLSDDITDGQAYLRELEKTTHTWIKTSYNTRGNTHTEGGTPLRKNFAGIGYSYDASLDAFIPSKPYPSYTLNTTTCTWRAPVAYPSADGNSYIWDETNRKWINSITGE